MTAQMQRSFSGGSRVAGHKQHFYNRQLRHGDFEPEQDAEPGRIPYHESRDSQDAPVA